MLAFAGETFTAEDDLHMRCRHVTSWLPEALLYMYVFHVDQRRISLTIDNI
jgi:hypothetical protein